MNINAFLKLNISEYLFKDLETMARSEPQKGEQAGAVSFPMLMSVLSGIELLGALVNPTGAVKVTNGKPEIEGRKHFIHFWTRYLAKEKRQYINYENLFYDLLRNGLAHTFMVKQGIHVYKDHKDHMQLDRKKRILVVGCIQFADDLKDVYTKIVAPIASDNQLVKVNGETITDAILQKNLDELLELYQNESERLFGKLEPTKEQLKMPYSHPRILTSLPSQSTTEFEEFVTPSGIRPYPFGKNKK